MSFVFLRAWARCLPVAVFMVAGAAQAAPMHLEAAGAKFAVDGSCANSVSITADSALNGHVVVDATADHPEEMAHLALETVGDTAKLRQTTERCLQDDEPTLRIIVRVPAGMAIALNEGGGVKYAISGVGGPLALDLSGGVELHADRAAAVALDLSGGGRVALGQIDGPLTAEISGGGTFQAEHVAAPSVTLEVSGGGVFNTTDGTIGKAKIELSGGGHVHIGGTVGDASADVSGGGRVEFARVTGQLNKDVSGAGDVTVGGQ